MINTEEFKQDLKEKQAIANKNKLTDFGTGYLTALERYEKLILSGVTFSSLEQILGKQTDFKLANEIKEIQAMEVFNYIVNEHNVKLTYKEWRKTVKNYYR